MKQTNVRYEIRKATQEDLPKVYEFEREYITTVEPDHLGRWDDAGDHVMETLESNMDHMFVADAGGQLAGHAYWALHDGHPCVYSVFVADDFRRLGIALALMRALEENMALCGYHEVTLSTLTVNPAQHLFARLGYTQTQTKDEWMYYIKEL